MPLRSPILDDRSYAQLRDELIARIPVYAPEWTDHHPSDPGITLIELFAFLGENLLFRFNQIPDATKLAFLDLLDIPVRPAVPATGTVTFTTTAPGGVLVPEESRLLAGDVEFHSLYEVVAWPLAAAAAIRAVHDDDLDEDTQEYLARASQAVGVSVDEARRYRTAFGAARPDQPGGDVLDPATAIDGTLYVLLTSETPPDPAALGGGLVTIGLVPAQAVPAMTDVGPCPGAGDLPPPPAVQWQVCTTTPVAGAPDPDAADPVWRTLRVAADTSRGLTQPGVVQLRDAGRPRRHRPLHPGRPRRHRGRRPAPAAGGPGGGGHRPRLAAGVPAGRRPGPGHGVGGRQRRPRRAVDHRPGRVPGHRHGRAGPGVPAGPPPRAGPGRAGRRGAGRRPLDAVGPRRRPAGRRRRRAGLRGRPRGRHRPLRRPPPGAATADRRAHPGATLPLRRRDRRQRRPRGHHRGAGRVRGGRHQPAAGPGRRGRRAAGRRRRAHPRGVPAPRPGRDRLRLPRAGRGHPGGRGRPGRDACGCSIRPTPPSRCRERCRWWCGRSPTPATRAPPGPTGPRSAPCAVGSTSAA